MKIPLDSKGSAAIALAAFLGVLAAVPTVTSASTKVIGGGMATDCSRRALAGEYDQQALRACDLALETQPLGRSDAAKTHVNRAVIYLRRADFLRSERDLSSAERLLPSLPEVFINRGAILIRTQRYADAVREIDRGLALGPSEPEKAYYNRAVARERLEDIKGAFADYSKAVQLAPNWDEPKKQLERFEVAPAPPRPRPQRPQG